MLLVLCELRASGAIHKKFVYLNEYDLELFFEYFDECDYEFIDLVGTDEPTDNHKLVYIHPRPSTPWGPRWDRSLHHFH